MYDSGEKGNSTVAVPFEMPKCVTSSFAWSEKLLIQPAYHIISSFSLFETRLFIVLPHRTLLAPSPASLKLLL